MSYKSEQQLRGENLIQSGFFATDMGGGKFMGKPRSFVLQDGQNNLYPGIRADALNYFRQNKVAWWGGYSPTGHVLSSQIACLNHLFPIRLEKEKVFSLLKAVSDDFVDVFPIAENMQGYIQFEAVGGDVNFLNEGNNTRGSNCTSVDAFIYTLNKNGKRFLIPIEWKYVEAYGNEDKSVGEKGETRKARYVRLIDSSDYLNSKTLSCCWYEPFYQLMRQTLWAEQVIKNKVAGIEAEDYLHLHIIPEGNNELLNKKYPCSGKGMEETWKGCLKNPEKYMVVSPAKLFSLQGDDTDIYKYLQRRYW
jgi:hypothetical protein